MKPCSLLLFNDAIRRQTLEKENFTMKNVNSYAMNSCIFKHLCAIRKEMEVDNQQLIYYLLDNLTGFIPEHTKDGRTKQGKAYADLRTNIHILQSEIDNYFKEYAK